MNKNFKGITLISLIITIIVLIILASVGTNVAKNTIKDAKYYNAISVLKVTQTKVNEMYEDSKNGEISENSGQSLDESGIKSKAQIAYDTAYRNNRTEKDIGSIEDYKYYTADEAKQKLGIDSSDLDLLINVKARTVLLLDGIQRDGKTYYSLNEIEDEQYNVEYINEI